jgi:hypothetical protein
MEHSHFFAGRLFYRVLKRTHYITRFLTDKNHRAKQLAQWRFGDSYYQKETFTMLNRYPVLFEQCKLYLGGINEPNILSFGCSTGLEVVSISNYLPNAQIMGVDINQWCISQCRKKLKDPRFSFQHIFSNTFKVSSNFDAIFCMAVFQRTSNRINKDNNYATGFTFQQFENEISVLHNKLKAGGLFIIDQADFNFADTIYSENYKPLDFEGNKITRNRPVFDRNNHKINDLNSSYRIFIKISPL